MGFQIPVDHKDRGERLVQQGKSKMLEQQVLRISLVQGVVGWSTQGGGKLAVLQFFIACSMQRTGGIESLGTRLAVPVHLLHSQGSLIPRMYTEKQPGNLCEFKLYTDVISRQL